MISAREQSENQPSVVPDYLIRYATLRHWYLVYPKGKEISLVARTFLDFAVEHGPRVRERMESMWPALRLAIRNSKAPDYSSARKVALNTT